MKTMDIILVILGVLAVGFTITMIWLFYKFQAVPDSLVAAFFAAVFGECGAMAMIQRAKLRKKDDEEEGEE